MNTVTSMDDELPGIAQPVEAAVRAIPPVWPLASSVAVNPFLGQAGESLAAAAARLERVAGIAVTMPRAWYLERIDSGAIAQVDLEWALGVAPADLRPASVPKLLAAARAPVQPPAPLSEFSMPSSSARIRNSSTLLAYSAAVNSLKCCV